MQRHPLLNAVFLTFVSTSLKSPRLAIYPHASQVVASKRGPVRHSIGPAQRLKPQCGRQIARTVFIVIPAVVPDCQHPSPPPSKRRNNSQAPGYRTPVQELFSPTLPTIQVPCSATSRSASYQLSTTSWKSHLLRSGIPAPITYQDNIEVRMFLQSESLLTSTAPTRSVTRIANRHSRIRRPYLDHSYQSDSVPHQQYGECDRRVVVPLPSVS